MYFTTDHRIYLLETISIAEPLQNRQHVHKTPNAVNTRSEREKEGELKGGREEEGREGLCDRR